MEDFLAMCEILMYPFMACMVIAALHCYMGLHVIRRGVIFVDLSLAQVAALGGAVAVLIGPELPNWFPSFFEDPAAAHGHVHAADIVDEHEHGGGALGYALSLVFAFLGAALFSVGRFKDNRVPHEVIIGIVYVVSAALALLVLSKTAHGSEEMDAMLLGNILFTDNKLVAISATLYVGLAIPHLIWGLNKFLKITEDVAKAETERLHVRIWDLSFYAIFGAMVTQSVRIGGVLVVFSYLIIPGVCAAILFP